MTMNWGVVGCGRLATEITIPALMISKQSTIVAMMDIIPERAKAVAERFNVDAWYGDPDELLSDPGVEVIYVATPNAVHAPVAIEAASRGKHVLCEKPLGIDVAECEEMIAACESNHVRLMVAQMSHLNAYNRQAEQTIRSGALGDVLVGRSYFSLLLPNRSGWRYDLQMSGGGALMDIGVYCVHTLRTLMGGTVEKVTAQVSPVPHDHVVDTRVVAMMAFDTEADAVFDCGFDYYSGNICHRELEIRGEGNGYQISGTRGTVSVTETFSEGGGGTIWAVVDGQEVDIQVHPINPYVAEMDYVVDCIEKDLPCDLDGTTGLEDVRIMMAIYESGRTGQPVEVVRE